MSYKEFEFNLIKLENDEWWKSITEMLLHRVFKLWLKTSNCNNVAASEKYIKLKKYSHSI